MIFPFHGENRGSNPLGRANKINDLIVLLTAQGDLCLTFYLISLASDDAPTGNNHPTIAASMCLT